MLTAKGFRNDSGAVLLGKSARQHFYAYFHPLSTALRHLLRRQMRAIVRVFEKRGRDVLATAPAGRVEP